MKYEDFPILNNNDYSLLREQYLSSNQTDRKLIVNEICSEISNIINSYWSNENLFNNNLNLAIKNCSLSLMKVLDNLTSLFNIQVTRQQSIPTFNIFSYIRKINSIITMLLKWASKEQKEYYKSTASKTTIELLNSLNSILLAAEESNVKFYKHM